MMLFGGPSQFATSACPCNLRPLQLNGQVVLRQFFGHTFFWHIFCLMMLFGSISQFATSARPCNSRPLSWRTLQLTSQVICPGSRRRQWRKYSKDPRKVRAKFCSLRFDRNKLARLEATFVWNYNPTDGGEVRAIGVAENFTSVASSGSNRIND